MRNKWYEGNYLLAGAMLALAVINGWRAYALGSEYPILAFLHGLMAAAIPLGVVFVWTADKRR